MRKRLRWGLPAMVMLIVAGVAISAASARSDRAGAPAQDKVKIALSNSFIGNKWRIEMENLFKAGCKMPPYKNQVDCSIYNSGNDVSKQTQQMSNLISQGVDAIVLNAASPTGLNGIIGQACARGILVVSYDNVVTAPCALKVNTDQFKFGQVLAESLAKNINGKGNVIMVTGVPGTFVDEQRNKGADSVWKKYPGIKVVVPVHGDVGFVDRAAEHRGTAGLAAEDRRHLGTRRNRRRAEGVHRREAHAAPADRRRSGERLPQVHAFPGLPGSEREGHLDRTAAVPRPDRARARAAGARESPAEG